MHGRLGIRVTGAAGPRRLGAAATAAVLVVLWASGSEAAIRPDADTPRAPGVTVTAGAQRTATVGWSTMRPGHAHGTMLAV